ncbi:MAG: hypothetical protein CVT97_06650 [Bacteroidetes bacterium HGW-Bacteroidetes-14]|jgi:hypothetical protein|nr:MAG: hypothetical protein CVT97_06650 [Bacteroidetes bacterium HGW-Bacteroidetes-14]
MKLIRILVLTGILLAVTFSFSFAQSDFRKGFIVTSEGDTLSGLIDYRGDLLMGDQCTFRVSEEEDPKVYAPGELREYFFDGGKHFVSRKVKRGERFLQILFKGAIDLYYTRYIDKSTFFIDKSGLSLIELPYEEGIIEIEQNRYEFKSTKHIAILYHYMSDAPSMEKEIKELTTPTDADLLNLVKKYSETVGNARESVEFANNRTKFVFDAGVITGLVITNNTSGTLATKSLQQGIYLQIWVPGSNEKLFVRTGISKGWVKAENYFNNAVSAVDIYRIPVIFQYQYPKGRVRPRFGYGFTLSSYFVCLNTFTAGVDVKINNNFTVSLFGDADLIPNEKIFVLPKEYLSTSIIGSLTYRFSL